MTTTLIVRDVVLLLAGDVERPADLGAHLRRRVELASALEPERVQECFEVLRGAGGEEADPRVVQSRLVLALAHPEAAASWGVVPAAEGRELAGRLERAGDVDAARDALQVLTELLPGDRGLERALGALLRRQGMVDDLVERYLARARALLDEGRGEEAIPWLRQVLLHDRSRKDVARTIRDLRFAQTERDAERRRRRRSTVLALCAGALAALAVLREADVRGRYGDLPALRAGDLAATRARLGALEAFVAANPVWHGALGALRERSELRVELERLEEEARAVEEERAAERETRRREIEHARAEGRRLAVGGDLEGALDALRRALELADPSWEHRERTERDVTAIEEVLEVDG